MQENIRQLSKSMLIVNEKKEILYISKAYEGRIYDYKLLNKEFPTDKDWFKNLVVIADLGYLG